MDVDGDIHDPNDGPEAQQVAVPAVNQPLPPEDGQGNIPEAPPPPKISVAFVNSRKHNSREKN